MTSIYNSIQNAIVVTSGINTIDNVFTDINNSNYLSKIGTIYTLNKNLHVADGATLYINDSIFQFGGEYRLFGNGGSTISIDNSTVDSIGATKGWIQMRRLESSNGLWNFKVTNSIIKNLGPGGYDHGAVFTYSDINMARVGVFLYPEQTDNIGSPGDQNYGKHAGSLVNISNNDIQQTSMTMGKLGDYGVLFSNNIVHNITSSLHPLLIEQGNVINNSFYDMPNLQDVVYSYGNANIVSNVFHDIGLTSSGSVIHQKEGLGGVSISNNLIYNITSVNNNTIYGINAGASNHFNIWSNFTNNSMSNSGPYFVGILVQGNGYLNPPQIGSNLCWDVRYNIINNTFDNINTGIKYSGYGNFFNCATTHQAPQHVITKDNKITNSNIGIWVNGYKFNGVSSNNDSFTGNSVDLWIGDTFIDNTYPPFINTNYLTTTIKTSTTLFKNYKYLDVKVIDINNTPISNAVITIINNTDINYPSINIEGQNKSSFTTTLDGHTPLPSDTLNSIAILDFYKTQTIQQEMNYTIIATYNIISNSTTVAPDATWYRTVPDTYQNTVTLQLPIDIGCPIPICNINITQV